MEIAITAFLLAERNVKVNQTIIMIKIYKFPDCINIESQQPDVSGNPFCERLCRAKRL